VDAFGYLSVLLSIVLGLAVTQLLGGFAALVHTRRRIAMYWPVPVQMAAVLLITVQVWWAMFGLRLRPAHRWTFIDFGVVLLQTVPLYLLAGLALPDVDRGRQLDLREHYYAHHRWFFSMLVLLILVSIVKVRVLTEAWPTPLDLGFQLFFVVGAAFGAWTSREWYHKLQPPLAALLLGAYIATLFTHLQ
jgi:hypothetical protein